MGKLSDVIGAVQRLDNHDVTLNAFVTVADATKCKIYMKNFGEFYNNQIEHAATIVLSRTGGMKEEKLLAAVALLREHNANAPHHHHPLGGTGRQADPGGHGEQGFPQGRAGPA